MTQPEQTWMIRDRLPNGEWSEPREVTLAQFRAELDAKKKEAIDIFRRNVAAMGGVR